jgi:hypothetical protein
LLVLDKLSTMLEVRGRFEGYREPLGESYHRVALLGFQHGHVDLARQALRKGILLAGARHVSRTWLGRLASRVLGVELKERLAIVMAKRGIASSSRRKSIAFRQAQADSEGFGSA